MDNTKVSGIILTSDTNFAYNFRLKVKRLGVINIEYRSYLTGLLDFLIEKEEGIVFIKTKSQRCLDYISKYALLQNNKNFVFVFITDDNCRSINCDNVYTFQSAFESIDILLPNIINKMHTRLYPSDAIPNSKIEEYIDKLFKSLKFPFNVAGYDYLRDCVKIMLEEGNKKQLILKNVYEIIAKRYDRNSANIEKSIRLAITNFIKTSAVTVNCIFGSEKVSNSEFISYMINTIKTLYCHSLKSI